MLQVNLPSYAEEFVVVHMSYVVDGGRVSAVPAQVLVKVIKKLLYVLGYATTKKAAHLAPHLRRKVYLVPSGQCSKAFYGGLFVPGPQFEGGEDVRLGAEAGLPEDGFKADTA